MSLFSNTVPDVATQVIDEPLLRAQGVVLHIRREDQLHPLVSGNKYRKLKYNLHAAKAQGATQLLTFGGAYSNHIAATACAAQDMGMPCIGVIRGEELAHKWHDNPTLTLAHEQGMQLVFVSRKDYRQKQDADFLHMLAQTYGAFYAIPEGGTNALAVKGCEEILSQQDVQDYDVVCCAVGTGGTIAGLINTPHAVFPSSPTVMGFAALNAPSLVQDVAKWVSPHATEWSLQFDYTFGGYAKTNDTLMAFIERFHAVHGIPLEPVYTGKMLYGLYDLVQQGQFAKGTRILAIHTGGLQGLKGFGIKMNS